MQRTEATAPALSELRPLKPEVSSTFPVYPDLVDALVKPPAHPDPTVAHVLGTGAGYAYSDAETVAMIMARMGLVDNRCLMVEQNVDAMFICSSAFVVQSQDGRVVVVCYRGTQPANFVNWLTDADVNPEPVSYAFPGGEQTVAMHGGFYRNVRATRYAVVTALQRALDGRPVTSGDGHTEHPMEALYVTGHSLGAAMAAIMTIMLRTEPAYAELAVRLQATYTYGQPMVGDPGLAAACEADEFLSSRVIRYVFNRDVVPQVPPSFAGPFTHFGQQYQYVGRPPRGSWRHSERPLGQAGNLVELAAVPLSFLARQVRALRTLPFGLSLDDHGPQHYIAALTPSGVRTEFGD
jgi:hypothetical protein